jgi:hypothetical protein
MTRIMETQRRAAVARDERRPPRRTQPTFSERYRGTEFDSWSTLIAEPADQPVMERGRQFVIVSGAAAVCLIVLVAALALSA